MDGTEIDGTEIDGTEIDGTETQIDGSLDHILILTRSVTDFKCSSSTVLQRSVKPLNRFPNRIVIHLGIYRIVIDMVISRDLEHFHNSDIAIDNIF
jgi:hypothetical protein